MTVQVIAGDCLATLRTLPDGAAQCCVTSPPYYGLRDYGHAGQIGLEPTPDEYVARMVEVFREVRRVLRDDGTLWLNVGDSYATAQKGSGGLKSIQTGNAGSLFGSRRVGMGDAKEKDLMMIPAMLALALRAPYYAGRIKREAERVWLAAIIDGEGCMFIHRRKAGSDSGARYTKADGTEVSYARTADTYGAGLEVANTSLAIIEKCIALTGVGSVVRQEKDRRQPLYRWNVRSNECRWIVQEVYPYLVAKQHQARLLLGCPPSGKAAEAAHGALIALHNGSTTHVDFPPPASLHEPGWYLRSDVIWAKSNPMPESVRDRPTSAHEHVFLLTKQARYFYDAEAIAEPAEESSLARLSQDVSAQAGSLRANGGAKTNGPMRAVGGSTRNARNVWTIATQPYSGAHFATMPPDLAERCIKAGSKPGDTVLDPFGGAGTTGLVADRLGRSAILCELNPEYARLARERITADAPLLAGVA
jgi:DNA modification methylase